VVVILGIVVMVVFLVVVVVLGVMEVVVVVFGVVVLVGVMVVIVIGPHHPPFPLMEALTFSYNTLKLVSRGKLLNHQVAPGSRQPQGCNDLFNLLLQRVPSD